MPFLWKVCKMGERKVQLPPHVQMGRPLVLWPFVLSVTDFHVSISMHSNFRLSQILRQPQDMCVESNSQAQDVHFYILMSSFLLVFGSNQRTVWTFADGKSCSKQLSCERFYCQQGFDRTFPIAGAKTGYIFRKTIRQ